MKYRVGSSGNFTVISNICLRDKSLSLKAKGLHTLMMSLPDDWEYSVSGLVAICKENETAVTSALKELSDAGYIKRTRVHKNGSLRWIYNIYEAPRSRNANTENQHLENQPVGNQPPENQGLENQGQINKDILNKDKQNKDIINKDEQNIGCILAEIHNEKLEGALREFLEMRREMKRPLGPSALKMLIKNLYEMADDPEIRAKIVEQSVRNNWRDVYALKDYGNTAGSDEMTSPTADSAAIEARFMERIGI